MGRCGIWGNCDPDYPGPHCVTSGLAAKQLSPRKYENHIQLQRLLSYAYVENNPSSWTYPLGLGTCMK